MGSVYILSLPFVSAFNLSQIFVIPLIVCVLALGWMGITNQLTKVPLIELDKIIIAFLACVIISVILNITKLSPKNLNHLFAIIAGYILFYFGAERISQHISISRILDLLLASYFFCLAFGILEFTVVNFTSFDINKIVFRPAIEEYNPGFLDIVLIRSRSTFEESGYFAAYMGMLGPILAHHLWSSPSKKWVRASFIGLTVICYFMAFSVSLFIFLPLAIALTTFLRTLASKKVTRGAIAAYASLAAIAIILVSSTELREILFLRKFEGNSYQDRSQRFTATIELIANSSLPQLLFGNGPGSYFNLDIQPAVSVYINFLRDFGIIGLSIYLFMILFLLTNLFKAQDQLGKSIFLSYLIVVLFFISTPIYFLPHYYLPLLLYRIRTLRMN